MAKNKVKIFGDLESEIMEVIWKSRKASVREVLLILKKKRKIAYTTIMTVMARLHGKGILKRKLDCTGAFIYMPVKDKESFLQKTSATMIKNFLNEYGDVAVAQFIDVIGASNAKQSKAWQDKLKALIK